MRTLRIVCLTMFLVLGFSGLIMAQEIPGGIVFSDGKQVIYQDFQTGQKISLTADLMGSPIKGPVAISEDGAVLIWFYNGNCYLKQLPDGEPYLVKIDKSQTTAKLVPGNVRNLTPSPQGTLYAFESMEKGRAWVQVEPGRPNARLNEDKYPKYIEKEDTYNAITFFCVKSGFCNGRAGNTAEYPSTFPFRTTHEAIGVPRPPTVIGDILLRGAILPTPSPSASFSLSVEDAQQRFSIKRDAHFLVWQKITNWGPSNQMVALIHQTQNGWGPIEIRDVNPNRNIRDLNKRKSVGYKNLKPDVWEIPVSLKNCEGLAWKPDGSLTYLTEGKVFSIDGNEIRQGIEKSGVTDAFYPLANVLNIRGVLVAEGIQGDQLHWVSDDTFLFRGKDKVLYCWRQGKVERLLSPVPDEFSFCDVPPLNFLTVASGKKKFEDEFLSNRYIGNIKIFWGGAGVVQPLLKIENIKEHEGLEFAFPTEANIEDIKDPSEYEYEKLSQLATEKFNLQVYLNQILLLRLKGKYTAIKPVEFERKYKSVAEMPKGLRTGPGGWQGWQGPLPFWKSATVEWKYWRTIPEKELATETPKSDKTENKLANMGNMGKSEALGRLMEPSNRYNPRTEFDIVVGDIKTVGSVKKIERIEGNKLMSRDLTLSILTNPLPGERSKCEYALLPTGTKLEFVTNPSTIQYKTDDVMYMFHFVQMKQIIILRAGDKYAAISPIEIRQNSNGLTLIYEWKYWPGVSSGTLTQEQMSKNRGVRGCSEGEQQIKKGQSSFCPMLFSN